MPLPTRKYLETDRATVRHAKALTLLDGRVYRLVSKAYALQMAVDQPLPKHALLSESQYDRRRCAAA